MVHVSARNEMGGTQVLGTITSEDGSTEVNIA
jgi:hypothetical protein